MRTLRIQNNDRTRVLEFNLEKISVISNDRTKKKTLVYMEGNDEPWTIPCEVNDFLSAMKRLNDSEVAGHFAALVTIVTVEADE